MSTIHQYTVTDTSQLETPAQKIASLLDDYPVVAFHGEMGAGKTTLIRAIAERLGITDTVTSPTFAIVNAYLDGKGNPVYHFDFYRIDDLREAHDMGCEEYFYSGSPCLIEWPGKIPTLLPDNLLTVTIEQLPDNPTGRTITITEP